MLRSPRPPRWQAQARDQPDTGSNSTATVLSRCQNLKDRADGVINRSPMREIPHSPVALYEAANLLGALVAETILASVQCANAQTGRTYGRKRSDQSTAKTPCEEGAVHIRECRMVAESPSRHGRFHSTEPRSGRVAIVGPLLESKSINNSNKWTIYRTPETW